MLVDLAITIGQLMINPHKQNAFVSSNSWDYEYDGDAVKLMPSNVYFSLGALKSEVKQAFANDINEKVNDRNGSLSVSNQKLEALIEWVFKSGLETTKIKIGLTTGNIPDFNYRGIYENIDVSSIDNSVISVERGVELTSTVEVDIKMVQTMDDGYEYSSTISSTEVREISEDYVKLAPGDMLSDNNGQCIRRRR